MIKSRFSLPQKLSNLRCILPYHFIWYTVWTNGLQPHVAGFIHIIHNHKLTCFILSNLEKMIREGRMTQAGLSMIEAAKKSGEWEKDRSIPDEIEMLPELRAALKERPIAKENFENFAPSYRKLYIRWVADAKRDETREKRIQKVVERAEKNLKPDMNM